MTRLPQPRKNARQPRTRVSGNGNAGSAANRRALEMLELVQSLSYITCLLAIVPRPLSRNSKTEKSWLM
jgi:hypothetical protein